MLTLPEWAAARGPGRPTWEAVVVAPVQALKVAVLGPDSAAVVADNELDWATEVVGMELA